AEVALAALAERRPMRVDRGGQGTFNVCNTLNSGGKADIPGGQRRANFGLMQCTKKMCAIAGYLPTACTSSPASDHAEVSSMVVSASLFEAYLECSTKCWLRAHAEPSAGN